MDVSSLIFRASEDGDFIPDASALVSNEVALATLVSRLVAPFVGMQQLCVVSTSGYDVKTATALGAAVALALGAAQRETAGARVLLVSDFIVDPHQLVQFETMPCVGIAAIYVSPPVRRRLTELRWQRCSAAWWPESRGAPSPALSVASSLARLLPRLQRDEGERALILAPFEHWTSGIAANAPVEDAAAFQSAAASEEDGVDSWQTWCVIDGHGGAAAAQMLQESLLPALVERLGSTRSATTAEGDTEAFVAAFRAAQSALLETTSGQGRAGACAVALALRRDGRMRIGHVGDCRALQVDLGLDGTRARVLRTRPLTRDHTTADQAECDAVRGRSGDAGAIRARSKEDPTLRVRGQLAITRAFGNSAALRRYITAEPTVFAGAIPRDPLAMEDCVATAIVLASDGAFDCASNDELGAWVADALSPVLTGRRARRLGPAATVVDAVLRRAAERARVGHGSLKSMKCGPKRRLIHDDVTVTIVLARYAA